MAKQRPLDEADLKNDLDRLVEEAKRHRITFLRIELQICFTLTKLVETELDLGNRENAARSLENAERAYATLVHFMSDAKHVDHMAKEEREELRSGILQLRAQLDELANKYL